MFADTLTITINGSGKVLTRINQDGYSSEYSLRTTAERFSLKIRNTNRTDKSLGRSVDRHNFEFVHEVYPVSPATVSTVRTVFIVFEQDTVDDPNAVLNFVVGYLAFLSASSGANITKAMNWES